MSVAGDYFEIVRANERIDYLKKALQKIVDIEENSPGTVSWQQMVEECKSIADNALNSKEKTNDN